MTVRVLSQWGFGNVLYKYCTGETREVIHEIADFHDFLFSNFIFSQQGLL